MFILRGSSERSPRDREVSAEFGVVMLIYLDHAVARRRTDLIEAIGEATIASSR
jgi:hypothetical protein